jgi:4-hydroxy-4-methyl-2-oxoglutarate aldolase
MITDELRARFLAVDTTAICDGDKTTRVMDSAVTLRSAQARMIGPAFTVRCRDDFLSVLRAVESATAGDVIVVDGGGREIALGGELFARGALARGVAGIVVDGGYRDMAYVAACQLPIYSRFVTPMAGTATKLGELQVPVACAGVAVNPGDVVLADEGGVVVVSPERLSTVLDAAAAVKDAEARLVAKLNAGLMLRDGLTLDEHVAALIRGEASSLRLLP